LLYDVVGRRGEILERVQLPPDRTLAAFGRNATLYLNAYDRVRKEWTIERVKIDH
jgi:hypothetical protein